MSMQQYCLRWNNHQPNFISVFSSLLNNESLVDVTLSAEGRHLQAHKLVLSACSSYFQSLFTINPCQHPIVILKDVKFMDLKVIIDFMYYGEVNVSQDQLPHILKTAEMLKIKGLAEIPVEPSVKSQNNLSEKAELLTPNDPNWNSTDNQHRQSLSPSPCPLSPGSKRKRLRKSSTGSGSGSTDRTTVVEEHGPNEVTLTSPLGTAVIKPDPGGFSTDMNNAGGTPQRKSQQHGSDSDMHRGSSHESMDSESSPHQITLISQQIPQQEMPVQHAVDPPTAIEMPGPSSTTTQTVTDRVIITTHAQFSQSQQQQHHPHQQQQVHHHQHQNNQQTMIVGPKRGRFLMRQSRIKRDLEQNPSSETSSGGGRDSLTTHHYLSVPHVRVERQVSDPLPAISPPPGNLLTVPGTNILVKQHSHPLLSSQTSFQSQSPPPPITMTQLQIIPQAHFVDVEQHHHQPSSSPIPMVISQENTASTTESSALTTIRIRSDELKRSVSSPSQLSTRSSHCPVVRPGPALGCNYCWNTVDNHGRILRRKTKYHCPECQTNLCIVPCFQEYHERHVAQTTLTTSVMRIFPKTGSI
ncbi:PREDICTED: protein bric-a-brac 1-like [Nicrophorus vespilloides]|uniref:Protein bric-a-brac 1-like n=1 Tax=Nicrophorus vespilloides TaxID=110193 RepID=A0ABM1MKF3_NICVS|nr:PREDICTED: protein bric-a-brac 1-like [Nicrophorus vespilloides]